MSDNTVHHGGEAPAAARGTGGFAPLGMGAGEGDPQQMNGGEAPTPGVPPAPTTAAQPHAADPSAAPSHEPPLGGVVMAQ